MGSVAENPRGLMVMVDDTSPKRLAVFLPSLAGGGAERVMVNLVREISLRGHPVDLVLSSATGPYLDDVPDNVRLVDLGASRVLGSLPALVRYLRRVRPTAMLAVMTHANLIAIWARWVSRVPTRVVVAEHDAMSQVTKTTIRRRAQLMPYLVKRFYPWADAVIAVSSGVADDLASHTGIDRGLVEVVFNLVVTPELLKAAKADAGHPWLVEGGPPVVIAVGRLEPKKDFVALLRAFAIARDQHIDAHLIILGEGADRQELEELARELEIEPFVSMPGFVENPYAYVARSKMLVLSSQYEGLPTVLIEALACGVPVVSTDCPAGPFEILDGGRHGMLVPVGDIDAIAKGITAGLDGELVVPEAESWNRFEVSGIVDQYLNVMLRTGPTPTSETKR